MMGDDESWVQWNFDEVMVYLIEANNVDTATLSDVLGIETEDSLLL